VRLPVVPGSPAARTLPGPDPSIDLAPLVLDSEAHRTVERDVVNNTATVTSGSRLLGVLPSGSGRIEVDQSARAVVAAERPDGAHVDEGTNVSLQLPDGALVRLQTRSRRTS